MKKINNLLRITIAIIAIASTTIFVSCSADELLCSGCDSDAPWSTPGGSTCYETQADCGSDCVRCD